MAGSEYSRRRELNESSDERRRNNSGWLPRPFVVDANAIVAGTPQYVGPIECGAGAALVFRQHLCHTPVIRTEQFRRITVGRQDPLPASLFAKPNGLAP
jgi:hypothetical protein